MQRIRVMLTLDEVDALEQFQQARGLANRSQATRLLIREANMSRRQREGIPDRDELLWLLSNSARADSVPAMRALLEEQRRDGAGQPGPSKSAIDELAKKRRGRR